MTEPKPLIADWEKVPHGLHLMRMFHKDSQKHVFHLCLKTSDAPWHEQPHVPFYSSAATIKNHAEFWAWAEKTLPIFDYPDAI